MTYRYKLTTVTTRDYGDSPSAGIVTTGTLVVIPDGSHWHDRPATIEIGVPEGVRPGAVYRVSFEVEE